MMLEKGNISIVYNENRDKDKDEISKYVDKIDVELYSWFVTGGGSIDIGSVMLDEVFGNDCMVDNPLYSNVNGNYNFMVAKWGE